MDLLQIATAGSVDDGKSTLIGRLLYETNSLKDDQFEQIKQKSNANGYEYLDFSLATDGLLTEREQGITIDVSHLYFKTPKRRFIIADSPGHIEYTRNMVTGTSNADTTILLLDARKGVIEQTKRHFYISQLLGIKKIIFAINKMDLIEYDQKSFNKIKKELKDLILSRNAKGLSEYYIPLSALKGDNLIKKSEQMPWYEGKTLLDLIESLEVVDSHYDENVFQIQYVIRPQREAYHDYRGFAGKVKSGTFSIGDSVVVFPSGKQTKISGIENYGKPVKKALQKENASFLLEDDLDISRGDSIHSLSKNLEATKEIKATVCWMQSSEFRTDQKYLLQFGAQRSLSKVSDIYEKIDISKGNSKTTSSLELNDIGTASFRLAHSVLKTPYKKNKNLGSFIIIDIKNNNTAGVGFIQ